MIPLLLASSCLLLLIHVLYPTVLLSATPPGGMEVSDEGDFLLAIDRYTQAITLNRNNHVLFSNRSAAYARVGKFAEALEDAKRCHELKPDWPKVCTYSTCHLLLIMLWPVANPTSQVCQHVHVMAISTCASKQTVHVMCAMARCQTRCIMTSN